MSRRPQFNEAEIRSLFEAQDPVARFSTGDLARALPTIDTMFASFDGRPAAAKAAHRPMRRVAVAAIAALLLALLTAAAWMYIRSRPSSAPLVTLCYRVLDVDAPSVLVGIEPGESPEEACARQWGAIFEETAPADLVTCIIEPDGATGVLPNPDRLEPNDACHLIAASLPEAGASYGGLTQEQVQALNADLAARVHQISVEGCVGRTDLDTQVQAALDAAGAEDWTVDDRTSHTQPWVFPDGTKAIVQVPTNASGQTCADFGLDVAHARVVLNNGWPHLPVESPGPPSGGP